MGKHSLASLADGQAIRPVSTLQIRVSDLDRSVEFYRDLFGIEFDRARSGFAFGALAGAAISLRQDSEAGIEPSFAFAVASETCLDSAVSRSRNHDVNKENVVGMGVSARLADPDGNLLDFVVLSESGKRMLGVTEDAVS